MNKIILMSVEGPSDETSLNTPLNMLSEHYNLNNKFAFIVEHGSSITKYEYGTNNYVFNKSNVVGKLKTHFSKEISNLMKRKKYKFSEFSEIVYMIDLDDCFLNSDANAKNKREVVMKLLNVETLNIKSKDIQFKLIFFSRDLEAVLHNNKEVKITKSTKHHLSNKFEMKFEDELDKGNNYFVEIFNSDYLKVWESDEEVSKNISKTDSFSTNLNIYLNKHGMLE